MAEAQLVRPSSDNGRSFGELVDTGLLWLINTTVFHPRGYALSLHATEGGMVTGWSVTGVGDEPFVFDDKLAGERFRSVREFLDGIGAIHDTPRV